MADTTTNTNPRTDSMATLTPKDTNPPHDGIHVEKVPEHENLVFRMNNLDPPVTPEEEKRVRRKIDLRLPPFLLVLYMFTWLDRGALGKQAMVFFPSLDPSKDDHRVWIHSNNQYMLC